VLDIRGLSIAYRGVEAVRNIDLTVQRGEIVGLIGESGSGKSSVAMSCLGLLGPGAAISAERLDICGTDVLSARPAQLSRVRGRDVAMVFQDAMGALDPTMRVGAQLAEVVRRHRDLDRRQTRASVLELLETVGIPEPGRRARQYPHQLSGGLRQRSAIAIALAGSPKLLLADEPTTALDVTVQAGILKLFRQIRDELNVGILLISHDIGVIAQTADRVSVMRSGEIVEHGSVHDVLGRPEHSYTRELLRAIPKPERGQRESEKNGAGALSARHGSQRPPAKLEAVNVSRTYGTRGRLVHALHPVDLEVADGEVLGVVGESGSGKTTLAKLLVHLDEPSTGRLSIDGLEYSRLRGRARRGFRRAVQMVFQHPAGSLNPRLKISTSVGEPLSAAGMHPRASNARVQEVLHEVGLDAEHGSRRPHELSGGQKQRVAIARAIAGDPAVVVLDEPTSALDVSVQAQVLELLADVQRRRNLTFVFISHNLTVVRSISDRVAVMYAGRIVELADADELFDNPAHWYTAELLAAVPSVVPPTRGSEYALPHVAAGGASAPHDPAASQSAGCAFASRCPAADEVCGSMPPPLAEIRPGHLSACYHPAGVRGLNGSGSASPRDGGRGLRLPVQAS
jgi:peptide/nickel transport system ATP-binding protein